MLRVMAAGAAVLLALSACAHDISAGQPVDVPASAGVIGVGCTVGELGVGPSQVSGLVTVEADPSSVVAIWSPGGNASPCQNVRTTGGQPAARALAHDVRTAPMFPRGTRNCPSDDGAGCSSISLFLADRMSTWWSDSGAAAALAHPTVDFDRGPPR